MQHFLASHQGQDIPIKHLYVEYRHWLETAKPFKNVTEELATLSRQGDHFRSIVAPKDGEVTFDLCNFLDAYDIRTAYPLLLALMDANIDPGEWKQISSIIESYLLRRAVCNLGTKNYNKIFLSLTRSLRKEGFSAKQLKEALLAQTGDSGLWPDDAVFREAWLHKPLYGPLNSPKLVHLFARLNQTYMSTKSESLSFSQPPSVEHILPQEWVANWPLPDGSRGLTYLELYQAGPDEQRAAATRIRNVAVQTLGNLTILSSGLNSAQSNYGWKQKRPELMTHSLLPLNQSLLKLDQWNEDAIQSRGVELFKRAVKIWPK